MYSFVPEKNGNQQNGWETVEPTEELEHLDIPKRNGETIGTASTYETATFFHSHGRGHWFDTSIAHQTALRAYRRLILSCIDMRPTEKPTGDLLFRSSLLGGRLTPHQEGTASSSTNRYAGLHAQPICGEAPGFPFGDIRPSI